jgi:hypothetical protein
MNNIIQVENIENYYGGLLIKEDKGLFYWSIEDYTGIDWEPIPKSLYDEIVKHNAELTLIGEDK